MTTNELQGLWPEIEAEAQHTAAAEAGLAGGDGCQHFNLNGYTIITTDAVRLGMHFSEKLGCIFSAPLPTALEDKNDTGLGEASGSTNQTFVAQYGVKLVGPLESTESIAPGAVAECPEPTIHGVRWSPAGIMDFVKGAAPSPSLIPELHANLIARIALPPFAAEVIVLWIVLTYMFRLFRRCPILHFHSELFGAGKSTALQYVGLLAFNACHAFRATIPALRLMAAHAPTTMLLDEMERVNRRDDDVVQFLNSRSDSNASHFKVKQAKGKQVPHNQYLFGPTAIAGLAKPFSSLASRIIRIEMQPAKLTHRTVSDFADVGHLRDNLYLWSGAHWKEVRKTFQSLSQPDLGFNRNFDVWAPLYAIGLVVDRQSEGQTNYANAVLQFAQQAQRAGHIADFTDEAFALALLKLSNTSPNRKGTIRQDLMDFVQCVQSFLPNGEKRAFTAALVMEKVSPIGGVVKRSGDGGRIQVGIEDTPAFHDLMRNYFPQLLQFHRWPTTEGQSLTATDETEIDTG